MYQESGSMRTAANLDRWVSQIQGLKGGRPSLNGLGDSRSASSSADTL